MGAGYLATSHESAGLPAARRAGPGRGARGRRAAAAGQAPGAVRRRRGDQGRRARRAARARGTRPGPGHHHADGARRIPGPAPARAGHARHARLLHRGRRAAGGRPRGRARGALRRPGDGQPCHLRAACEDCARRHRPGRDRQEPGAGRADPRRRPGHAGRPHPEHGRADRRERPSGHRVLAALHRRLEAPVPAAVHPGRRRPAEAAARGGAAVRAHRRRGGRGGRRRPAPDARGAALLVHDAAILDQLRRPRHDGLCRAGRDGRPGGQARRAGGRDRRRRLLPDDRAGAGHLRDRAPADQGADLQQRLPRHGPAVAGAVLRGAVLRGRARHRDPGLREAGRGVRLPWPALRSCRRRRRGAGQGARHDGRANGRGLPGARP